MFLMIGLYQQQKLYQKLDVTPVFLKALLITEQFCDQYMLLKTSSIHHVS